MNDFSPKLLSWYPGSTGRSNRDGFFTHPVNKWISRKSWCTMSVWITHLQILIKQLMKNSHFWKFSFLLCIFLLSQWPQHTAVQYSVFLVLLEINASHQEASWQFLQPASKKVYQPYVFNTIKKQGLCEVKDLTVTRPELIWNIDDIFLFYNLLYVVAYCNCFVFCELFTWCKIHFTNCNQPYSIILCQFNLGKLFVHGKQAGQLLTVNCTKQYFALHI